MKKVLVIIVILLVIAAGLYVAARRHLISIPGVSPDVHIAAVTTERKSLMLEVAPEGKVVHIVIRRPQTN